MNEEKLRAIFMERYLKLLGGVASIATINKAEPEWQRICDSFGIWRTPELPEELPEQMVLVKDPDPLSSMRYGTKAVLVMPKATAEKILVIGFP